MYVRVRVGVCACSRACIMREHKCVCVCVCVCARVCAQHVCGKGGCPVLLLGTMAALCTNTHDGCMADSTGQNRVNTSRARAWFPLPDPQTQSEDPRGSAVVQEVERVVVTGRLLVDPRLLLAECQGVPEQDASPHIKRDTSCSFIFDKWSNYWSAPFMINY